MGRRGLVIIACAACISALLAAGPARAAQEPIEVKPGNPFYFLIRSIASGGVDVGQVVDGRRMAPFTSCAGAELSGQSLAYSGVGGADLRRAKGPSIVTSFASIARADLHHAQLSLAALALTGARSVNLTRAALFVADLSGSNMRGADLRRANLAGALAAGTDLRGADLRGADLAITDLHGARLGGARLRGAAFCNTIMPDGHVRHRRKGCPTPKVGPRQGEPLEIPPELPVWGLSQLCTPVGR